MYDCIQRESYWPYMASDEYQSARDCNSCARTRHTTKTKHKIRLFSPAGPLYFVSVDTHGPLPKMKTDRRVIVVIIERLSTVAKSTPTTKTKATTVATIFSNDWIANFGIPSKVLTKNGPLFKFKIIQTFSKELGSKPWNDLGVK